MGLDACVYCDCFEKGRLLRPPKLQWNVYVDEDGGRTTDDADPEEQTSFDHWNESACCHSFGLIVHHRLGNATRVARLRDFLEPHSFQMPVLLQKVIYDGTHCGDFLRMPEVRLLQSELQILAEIHDQTGGIEDQLRWLESQLRELAEASLRLNKSIVF